MIRIQKVYEDVNKKFKNFCEKIKIQLNVI